MFGTAAHGGDAAAKGGNGATKTKNENSSSL
jgi:hypothetical protein